MKYLSVCSGIEAASVAWHPLGWEPLAFSEIEPFPRKVLAHHYPDVPCHGDFTKLRHESWIKDADVLVGGTPCQAFSIAGLRQSLNDDRGNLTLEFVRLANAIDDLRPHRPTTIVWENVPGVLSVADNAFGCFLGALVGNDTPLVPTGGKWTNAGMVIGPQRSAAWRVLDAQYFGVAQRRRRVFVVASAREGFDPAEVLFEREGVRRHSPPSRNTGERVADSLTVGANQYSGFNGEPVEASNPEVAQCLTTGVGQRYDPDTETLPVEVVGTLDAQDGRKWGSNQWVNQNKAIVEVAGTMGARTGQSIGAEDAADGYMIPVAFHPTQDPISSTDGSTHALGCGSSHGQASVAVVFGGDIARTLSARYDSSPCADRGPDVVAFSIMPMNSGKDYKARETDIAQPLMTNPVGGNQGGDYVAQSMAVRRLTPRECERLQGFPDDYTAIPGAADGPRYKALGNSMAVPVMRWIGKKIANQKKVLVAT
jgi:DNA (cytosine-5)-methyltransferase 1